MIHKATNLIAETFALYDVDYRIAEENAVSFVEASFIIESGLNAAVRYISDDEGNDVAIRVFGLVRSVPVRRRADVMALCNALCAKVRYFQFYLDTAGCVNIEADLPAKTEDTCLGECCLELFVRLVRVIKTEYPRFKGLLPGSSTNKMSDTMELLRLLNELHDQPNSL